MATGNQTTYTPNYNLCKPGRKVRIDPDNFNGNSDIIDTELKKHSDSIEATENTIGIVEKTDTATHNIAEGSYVLWKEVLCKASSPISIGDTLTSINLPEVEGGLGSQIKLLNDENSGSLESIENVFNDIGIVENTDIATHNIAEGQYVIWKEILHKATNDITLGDVLSLNTNLAPVNNGIGSEVNELFNRTVDLLSDITNLFNNLGLIQNSDIATQAISKDTYVIWKQVLCIASTNITEGSTLAIGTNLSLVNNGGFNSLYNQKLNKVSGVTANNFASFNSDGTIKDSGKSASSFSATSDNATLAWNTQKKIATVLGTEVNVKLPTNPYTLDIIVDDFVSDDYTISANSPKNLKANDFFNENQHPGYTPVLIQAYSGSDNVAITGINAAATGTTNMMRLRSCSSNSITTNATIKMLFIKK